MINGKKGIIQMEKTKQRRTFKQFAKDKNIEISVQRYLIDALKAIEDENVSIQFNSPLGPCIIKPVEGELYKYLILPLRM